MCKKKEHGLRLYLFYVYSRNYYYNTTVNKPYLEI